MKGFMGKILRVDLTTGKIEDEIIGQDVYEHFMAGIGIGAYILYRDIPAHADPLGPDNILGFTPGLLTGTPTFMMGRWMAHAKSPLTGGIGDSNCGGQFAPEIKRCGYDGIFIKGISSKPVYLYVGPKGAELRDASHVWGIDAVEAEEILTKECTDRKRPRVALIGQAGENVSLISGIVNDGGRIAARSGLGAVMGSKKLKALVLSGNKLVKVDNLDAMREESKLFAETVRGQNLPRFFNSGALKLMAKMVGRNKYQQAHDGTSTYGMYKKSGTQIGTQLCIMIGDAPIKNWQGGPADFPVKESDKINNKGLKIDQREVQKYHCAQCAVGCGGILNMDDVKGAKGKFKHSHRPEYETTGAMSGLLLNSDPDSLLYANEVLNRAGMDTISAGGTAAFAIECYENGLITKEETGGLELTWGNSEAILKLFDQMISRSTWLGHVMADGVKKASERIGKGSKAYAVHAGGQEPAMHDPRHNVGFGVDYSFSPTPGKHTNGANDYATSFLWERVEKAPEPKRLHVDETIKPNSEYALCAVYGHWHKVMIDVAGGCFLGYCGGIKSLDYFKAFNYATGWEKSPDQYMEIADRINTLRQLFNIKHGVNPVDNLMHSRMELPRRSGPNQGRYVQIAPIVSLCWRHSGWDPNTGHPLKEHIHELNINKMFEEVTY